MSKAKGVLTPKKRKADGGQVDETPVYRICLTGGPCGGKTTSLAILEDRLVSLGFRVFRVPEAATILLSTGISFYDLDKEGTYRFQVNLLKVMTALEDALTDMARASNKPAIVLCDRGVMDCAAYVEEETWQAILDEHSWTTVGMRDARYDAVVHIVTAAEGAEEFYTTDNNATRTEPPELAREVDRKIKQAWVGHPYLYVIDNTAQNFQHKVDRAVNSVLAFVGHESEPRRKKKFLVKRRPDDEDFAVDFQDYDVDSTYLHSTDGTQQRIRRRGQHGTSTYSHTIRSFVQGDEWIEVRRNLTGREYVSLLSQAEPTRDNVKKIRRCFLWNNHYYELDYFKQPQKGLILLEVHVAKDASNVLPPFLTIEREVTEEPEYSMWNLARKPNTQE